MIAVRFITDQPYDVSPGTINLRNDLTMPFAFSVGTAVHRTHAGFVTDATGNRFSLPIIDDSIATGNNSV